MRRQLAALTEADVRSKSAAIWERLAVLEEFNVAKCISAYVSTRNEVETRGLIRQLLAMGRQVCAPAFDGEWYRLAEIHDPDADLAAGKFGILEPKNGQVVTTEQVEAWLVPGLAFDLTGNRLGRGQGFYDALLRGAHGARIALAYDFQILNEVPAEAHDARVDFIVTEKRVVETKGN